MYIYYICSDASLRIAATLNNIESMNTISDRNIYIIELFNCTKYIRNCSFNDVSLWRKGVWIVEINWKELMLIVITVTKKSKQKMKKQA